MEKFHNMTYKVNFIDKYKLQYDVRTLSVENVTSINEKLINSLEKDFGER